MSRAAAAAARGPVRMPVWRARFVLAALVAAFVVLAGRSVYLQAMRTEFLQEKGEARYSRVLEIPATRGRVLDRNGEALAVSTPVKSIWAIPGDVELSAASRRKLAALLRMEPAEISRKLAEARDFVYLKRQIAPETAQAVEALGIKGLYQQREFRRYYPGGEVTAHVVGFTGVDDTGQEGVELAHQGTLGGKAGSRRVIKDRLGAIVEDVESIRSAQDGTDLTLSIDSKIQSLAFTALKSAVIQHRAKAGAIVALDVRTGEYQWHYQTVPGEEWDYTATQQMILADLRIGGKVRKVIMQAPKNGFFYVLDRRTGELISARATVPINWASGIDMKTGRPIANPAVRYGKVPVMVSPGAGGAHNFNAMAFSPKTGLVYLPVSETYMAYAAADSFDPAHPGLGTSFAGYDAERKRIAEYADAHSRQWLSARDPVTQKEVWRTPDEQKGSGGVLVTAGNLVFEGKIGTTFAAYRADTGRKVWEMPVQQVPIAAPITYMVDGVQYIAVNAGWGGGLAHVERSNYAKLFIGKPRLLVFKLGGSAKLPPMPRESTEVPELAAPPKLTASADVVAKGEQLYGQNCALCHGVAARGGVKDLRHMSPQTHADFLAIVLGGKRAANGMASFADVLTKDEAEAIHQYLIARANADWDAPAK